MAKPSLKELESQAGQVGHIHAMAFLRRISATDLADYVGNEDLRSRLRESYAAAVAEAGEKKAMKTAASAAYLHAERTILGAGAARGYAPVLRAAERAVQTMLTEQPSARPRVTVNGRPQPVPESSDSIERRFRLFYESARRLAGAPLAQPSASGHLLGRGSGLEQLVSAITSLYRYEQSLIRWVAVRGAIASVHGRTLGGDSPDAVIALAKAMGLVLVQGQDGGVSVTPLPGHESSGHDPAAALVLGRLICGFLWDYEQIMKMSFEETIAHPRFAALTDTLALDCIAWSATALLRVGVAQELVPKVPEPDALTEPGWYVEPVFAGFERYWDGTDWTPKVRKGGQEGIVSLR